MTPRTEPDWLRARAAGVMPIAELARRMGVTRRAAHAWTCQGVPLNRVPHVEAVLSGAVTAPVPSISAEDVRRLMAEARVSIGALARAVGVRSGRVRNWRCRGAVMTSTALRIRAAILAASTDIGRGDRIPVAAALAMLGVESDGVTVALIDVLALHRAAYPPATQEAAE